MTTQIAVRLPDSIVGFLDQEVSRGRATSRTELVTSALQREMRRSAAAYDVETLKREGPDEDLDSLVSWPSTHLPLDD